MPVWSVSGECSPPGWQMATFLTCAHMITPFVSARGDRGRVSEVKGKGKRIGGEGRGEEGEGGNSISLLTMAS